MKVAVICYRKRGCDYPSDVEQAIELGLDAVKFFPAEAAGGINAENLINYLDFKKPFW